MEVTPFGLVIGVVGLVLLLRAKVTAMLWMTMICALFGGSAAILMPALGGASVPPAQFALVFLIIRILLPGSGLYAAAGDGLRANVLLAAFTAYGIATAMIASRLFAGTMQVVALRYTVVSNLFATTALTFSPQNITTSVYMLGTFLTGFGAFVAMRERVSALRFVNVAVIVCWVHIFFGVSAAMLKGTPYDDFISFMRNAHYAQNDQSFEGYVRINGVWPEPSSYAAFGFDWFVILFECWFRNVLPRRTGPAAAAMALVLFFSTSTTAYAALAVYAAILVLRILVLPQSLPVSKGMGIAGAILAIIIAVAATAILFPDFASLFWRLLLRMTIAKQDSESGLQRAFWSKTGLNAFVSSWGIGVGPGSFRSSTIVTAMLGSVGVIGTGLFVLYTLTVIKPLRISTYFGQPERAGITLDPPALVGVAAAWGAIGVLIQAALTAPTCDPGTDFGLFAGAALALRVTGHIVRPATRIPSALDDYAQFDPVPPQASSAGIRESFI